MLAPSAISAGRRVKVKGMELVQVRDGKIVVDTLYYDNMTVLGQLSLAPPDATV